MDNDIKNNSTLVVDLDGSLIRTDLLYESFLILVKSNPLYVFLAILWLLKGKSNLKDQIASRVDIKVEALPYNEKVIHYIKRFNGKKILATASNEKYAKQVAEYLGVFDEVLASNKIYNLRGKDKAKVLLEKYPNGFEYIGDSMPDLKVWEHATRVLVCSPSKSFIKTIKAKLNKEPEIISEEVLCTWKAVFKALRPHQWAKNLLLFSPLAAAHMLTDTNVLFTVGLAAISFSFCASSVYILNDLFDLEDDRAHHRKKNRPFASGALPIPCGLALVPILLIASLLIALQLPLAFLITLIVYYAITLAYSLYFKRVVIVDIISLSVLYIIRMIAGAKAAGIPLTFWFLAFGVFLFFSLAVLKRYIELLNSNHTATKRGYRPNDIKLIPVFGISSAYLSILIMVLYLNQQTHLVVDHHPIMLLIICFIVLFWYTRLWILASRDELHDDPVVFVIKDLPSLLLGLIAALILYYLT